MQRSGIFKRDSVGAGKASRLRKALCLVIERNAACAYDIRLKTGSYVRLMLKHRGVEPLPLDGGYFRRFSPFRLDGRQPNCVSKKEKITRKFLCVRCFTVFKQRFFVLAKGKAAGNTDVFLRLFTKREQKSSLQNRQVFCSSMLNIIAMIGKIIL